MGEGEVCEVVGTQGERERTYSWRVLGAVVHVSKSGVWVRGFPGGVMAADDVELLVRALERAKQKFVELTKE